MADENTDPPKKKSPIMLILAGVFGGIILVGGGLGAGYFLFGGNQPLPEDIAQDIIASKSAGEAGAGAEGGAEGEGEPEIDCPVEEELEEGEEMPAVPEEEGEVVGDDTDSSVGLAQGKNDNVSGIMADLEAILASLGGGEEEVEEEEVLPDDQYGA